LGVFFINFVYIRSIDSNAMMLSLISAADKATSKKVTRKPTSDILLNTANLPVGWNGIIDKNKREIISPNIFYARQSSKTIPVVLHLKQSICKRQTKLKKKLTSYALSE
jgi:hypothetical protein